jgi:hypothetical protein
LPERAGNVMKHCQRPKTLWKEMPRLPEIKNVMERDATISRDQKRYEKRCHDCQRPKTLWKRCHALPEAGTLCKEMPFIARGFGKCERVGKYVGKT